jgi:uncharacterized membrane protein required for colicin V production
MNPPPAPNWFDLLVLVTICFGVMRGRKRGMSEELLDVLQWVAIVVGGALLYKPFGQAIATATNFNRLATTVLAYGFIAIILKVIFTGIKRAVGEKLVHADTFGNFEYYLGMLAGALRFSCILFFTINFLHAKHVSDAERAATARMQAENFGSISFPTIGSLRQGIFFESVSGQFVRKHLSVQLLEPAGSDKRPAETIGRRRERAVEEIIK